MTLPLMLATLCPYPVVGQTLRLCLEHPPSSSQEVLRFLANRGYPLAVFLRFSEDTAYVDEGPLILAGDLVFSPPFPLRGVRLSHGVFRLSSVERLVRWLDGLGIPTHLFWEGTHPVLWWSLPPPWGGVTFTWDGRQFLGEGRLAGWLARGFIRADLSVEGYGGRERARMGLLRPLQPLVEARLRTAYDNAEIQAFTGEGGLQMRVGPWVVGGGLHLVWDTTRRTGGVLWMERNRPQDTLSLWGLARRRGGWARGQFRFSGRLAELFLFAQGGTLKDSTLAEPRGGAQGLHGWPGTGMFLQGLLGRLGVGPPPFRILGEGLWEPGGMGWSLALRVEMQGVQLWFARGMPDGQVWVYVSLPMGQAPSPRADGQTGSLP